MEFPPRATEIVQALYERHLDLADGDDDTRRALMRLIAGQLAFELGPQYGCKSAGDGRPQGPTTIAYESHEGLGGWRILDSDGSVGGVPNAPILHPPFQSFAAQRFLPVAPFDALGVSGQSPASPSPIPDLPPIVVPPPVLVPSVPPAPPVVPVAVPEPTGAMKGASAILEALVAWGGPKLVSLILGWWSRRATPKAPTGGPAIPRPTIPTRSKLQK